MAQPDFAGFHISGGKQPSKISQQKRTKQIGLQPQPELLNVPARCGAGEAAMGGLGLTSVSGFGGALTDWSQTFARPVSIR
jgi:hypothetical protein